MCAYMKLPPFRSPATWCAMLLSLTTSVRATSLLYPARFGVIDIVPHELSAEAYQNPEPSLAVGLNVNYGKIAVHAFNQQLNTTLPSTIYVSANLGGPPWTAPWSLTDYDATMDWSTGATSYLALLPYLGAMHFRQSPDPTTTDFTGIYGLIWGVPPTLIPDEPWLRAVTVNGVDHIFVGWNDMWQHPGKTAKVIYSLDGGAHWDESALEKLYPSFGQDAPPVRLAVSSDGRTVYSLFLRLYELVDGGDVSGRCPGP